MAIVFGFNMKNYLWPSFSEKIYTTEFLLA